MSRSVLDGSYAQKGNTNRMNLLFISLGCDKNLVDTEKMLGILGKEGYSFVDDENEADIVVVNTCCFIGDAKEESVNTILQMAELKKNGRLKALIVTGCLAQRYKQEIIDEIPEVDAILGTTSYEACRSGDQRGHGRRNTGSLREHRCAGEQDYRASYDDRRTLCVLKDRGGL